MKARSLNAAGGNLGLCPVFGPDSPYGQVFQLTGQPEEVARAILWLAGAEASFITGSEYVVDGGLLLGPALKAEAA